MHIRAQIAPYYVGTPLWTAVDDDTYDGEGSPIGLGGSLEEAIDDLLWQLAELGIKDEEGA